MTAITTLPWRRVDFIHGFIDFRDPAMKVTNKRRVKVAMADFLAPVLAERKRALLEKFGEARLIDQPVIGFGGNIGPEIKRIFVAAGINENGVRAHTLRHTFVNWGLIRTKGDVVAVARAVGDSISTIERHYVAAFPEGTRVAVNATIAPPQETPTQRNDNAR